MTEVKQLPFLCIDCDRPAKGEFFCDECFDRNLGSEKATAPPVSDAELSPSNVRRRRWMVH